MEILNKLFGHEEHVIQLYDPSSRRWEDEGIVEEVNGPDEYDLEGDDKRRLICRKKGKIKNIIWTTNGTDDKPKKRTRQKKKMSDLDSIQSKADSIRKDRQKLLDVKDAIEEIMGGNSSEPEHEEWMYPGMAAGLNHGIGHAFLTGMDEKKGDIAEAGLEMVRGFSNVMSALPLVAVAYAKSKGVNVGLFGIDEQQILGGATNKQPPDSVPQEPANEGVMVEHDDGFEIDTIQEDDDCEEESDDLYETDEYCGGEPEEPEFDRSEYGEPELVVIEDDEDDEPRLQMVSKKLGMDEEVEPGNTPDPYELDFPPEKDFSAERTRRTYESVDQPDSEDIIPESITDEEAAELFESDEEEDE